ncbi:MAG TPA: mandelate racemase/muconate lactonizing enzyme family protein [Chloroflexota bacterium]|jgi:L-alanine-DL-glutamate epimerase-like enolase superfamily enzyme|nr:mandelate racemase/muconate lactonizing enzyme family protein [Chloroflexota bacterium]
MKITEVRTLCLSRLHERERQWATVRYRTIKADCVIVVISTDEGLIGIGEACPYGPPLVIRDWVDYLSRVMIGRDVADPNVVPHPDGRSWSFDCAVAGIDIALWDLKARISGKPLAALLGHAPHDRVRLYASSGCRYDWRDRPEQLIEEVVGYADQGYSACKVRIGTEWSWDGVTVDHFLGLMRELAQTINGRIELMVDANQRLTEEQALPVAKELDHLRFAWFEEPIAQTDIGGYSRLNAAVDMPITGGEQFTTLEQFKPYLDQRAYAIVQPDVAWCGITEAMKIAEVASQFGVDVCPHNWHNGVMTVAHAHYVAALPNPRVLELCMIQGPLQWEILAARPPIRDGWIDVPQTAGLGVTLSENLEERFPYIEGRYYIDVVREPLPPRHHYVQLSDAQRGL